MAITACGDEYTEEDKEALHEAEKGYDSTITQEVWGEFFEQHMPEVERAIEEVNKGIEDTFQEIEAEFPSIEEVAENTLELQPETMTVQLDLGRWDLDNFEKEGFGPFVNQPPDFSKILPEVKIEERSEVKLVEGGRILGETDRITATDTKIHAPRFPGEIEQKIFQLEKDLRMDFKDEITPEEKAIIKESEASKDAEKIQREWIKEGIKIHEYGHRIIMRTLSPDHKYSPILTQPQIAKWQRIYRECKELGKFVTPYAAKDWQNFFCENLKVFFTHPEWVKEQHPAAYHEIEKTVLWLKQLEYYCDAIKGG